MKYAEDFELPHPHINDTLYIGCCDCGDPECERTCPLPFTNITGIEGIMDIIMIIVSIYITITVLLGLWRAAKIALIWLGITK